MASIVTNIAANSAFRNVQVSSAGLDKQIAKLSSGFRINRSGDDAAGLAIANKLRAEVRSLQQASRNAAQGISMQHHLSCLTLKIPFISDFQAFKPLAIDSRKTQHMC